MGGGLLRDVVANMTPMIFCKRIYAIAALKPDLCSDDPDCPGADRGDHQDRNRVYHSDSWQSARRWDLPVFVLEQKIK